MIPLVSATSEHWAFAVLLLSLMLKFLFWPPCNIKSVCPICHQSGSLVAGLCTPVSLFWLMGCGELVRCVPVVFPKVNLFFVFSHNQSLKFSLSFNYIALILVPWWSKGPPTIKARDNLAPKCFLSDVKQETFYFSLLKDWIPWQDSHELLWE